MTEFALSPATKWDASTSPYRSPRVMLEQGELTAYRVRGNGTMRHVSLYPADSTEREVAEFISDRVDMDGASVNAVARELHISTATVRRYLEGLELTEEIEAGDWDGLTFGTDGQPVFDTTFTEEDTEEEPLPGGPLGQGVGRPLSPEAPGAHNEDEPAGTTAEELPDTLAKSLAATVAAGNARLAEVTANLVRVGAPGDNHRTAAAALHMCVCDKIEGTHAVHAPVVRRTRSH